MSWCRSTRARASNTSPHFAPSIPTARCPPSSTQGPGGKETRVFDSSAILLYLAEKAGRFLGQPADQGELLSWLFFLGTGLGPFSGQAVHFQFAAPDGLDYAVNRYRREAERHYRVLDSQLAGRDYIVGSDYTMVDMSAWGWIDRASRVTKGSYVSPDSSKNRATLAGLGVGWK
jgi:GST-like protein